MNFRYDKPRRTLRDFHRPRTGNPLFPRSATGRHRGVSRPMTPWASRGGFAALAAIALWGACWSPAFRIDTVEVVGVDAPTEIAIRAGLSQHMQGRMLFVFPQRNLLLFDKSAATEDIAAKTILARISINKRLPDTLVVDAEELEVRAALDWKERLYALDERGTIIRELSDAELNLLGELPPRMAAVEIAGLGAETMETGMKGAEEESAPEGSTIPLITLGDDAPTDAESAAPGQSMVTGASLTLTLQAHARLADVAGAKVRRFVIRPASETVEALMEGEWRVLMSSALPFDAQAERLALVLKEKIGNRKAQLEYVDLRYNERIFFRMKGEVSP